MNALKEKALVFTRALGITLQSRFNDTVSQQITQPV
jgi:hypothetical protein